MPETTRSFHPTRVQLALTNALGTLSVIRNTPDHVPPALTKAVADFLCGSNAKYDLHALREAKVVVYSEETGDYVILRVLDDRQVKHDSPKPPAFPHGEQSLHYLNAYFNEGVTSFGMSHFEAPPKDPEKPSAGSREADKKAEVLALLPVAIANLLEAGRLCETEKIPFQIACRAIEACGRSDLSIEIRAELSVRKFWIRETVLLNGGAETCYRLTDEAKTFVNGVAHTLDANMIERIKKLDPRKHADRRASSSGIPVFSKETPRERPAERSAPRSMPSRRPVAPPPDPPAELDPALGTSPAPQPAQSQVDVAATSAVPLPDTATETKNAPQAETPTPAPEATALALPAPAQSASPPMPETPTFNPPAPAQAAPSPEPAARVPKLSELNPRQRQALVNHAFVEDLQAELMGVSYPLRPKLSSWVFEHGWPNCQNAISNRSHMTGWFTGNMTRDLADRRGNDWKVVAKGRAYIARYKLTPNITREQALERIRTLGPKDVPKTPPDRRDDPPPPPPPDPLVEHRVELTKRRAERDVLVGRLKAQRQQHEEAIALIEVTIAFLLKEELPEAPAS